MKLETQISYGYLFLIEVFGKANNLNFEVEKRIVGTRQYITIIFDDDSDTAMTLTFMSVRHSGIENMLCDYLIKCKIDPVMIPVGKYMTRRTPEEMEKDWQEHRKKIGLAGTTILKL